MGDEKELLPLNLVQMNNVKFGIPQDNFQISNSTFTSNNGSFKEFDTLGRRRPYSVNVEKDTTAATSERL